MKSIPSFSLKISSFFCFPVIVLSYFIEFIASIPCIDFDGVACLIILILKIQITMGRAYFLFIFILCNIKLGFVYINHVSNLNCII